MKNHDGYNVNNDFHMKKFLNDIDTLGRSSMFIHTTHPLNNKPTLLISNYQRFLKNEDQIKADLARWNGTQTGMVITFEDLKDATIFLLKWN
jgi:hypothetical protein